MSFVSTFNSLSTNGWSAKSVGYSLLSLQANLVGSSVSISGDGNYAVATREGGNVFTYTINNTSKLTTQTSNINADSYVVSMDYTGNRFISGQNDYTASGYAKIYSRTGTTWSLEQQINPPANTIQFGVVVALNNYGNIAVIGQDYYNGGNSANAARIYAYSRSGTTWSLSTTIPSPSANSGFGPCLDLDGAGSTMVVGDRFNNTQGSSSGAVYVYNVNGSLLANLYASDGAANNGFGTVVNISNDGNTIAVGSSYLTRKTYIFRGSGSSWTEVEILTPQDIESDQTWPRSIAMSGNGENILVGCDPSYANSVATTNGAALFYVGSGASNNWQYAQKIQYTSAVYFGYAIDVNYTGTLLLSSAGGGNGAVNSPNGNVILLGQ